MASITKMLGTAQWQFYLEKAFWITLILTVIFVVDSILITLLGLDEYLFPMLLRGLVRHLFDLVVAILLLFVHLLAVLLGDESADIFADDFGTIFGLVVTILLDDLLFFLPGHAAMLTDAFIRTVLGFIQETTSLPLLDLYMLGVDGFIRASALFIGALDAITQLERDLQIIKSVTGIVDTSLNNLLGWVLDEPLQAGIIAATGTAVLYWGVWPNKEKFLIWKSSWFKRGASTSLPDPYELTDYDITQGEEGIDGTFPNPKVKVSAQDVEPIWQQVGGGGTSEPIEGGGGAPPGGGSTPMDQIGDEPDLPSPSYEIIGYKLKAGAFDKILDRLDDENSFRGWRAAWKTLKVQSFEDAPGANVRKDGDDYFIHVIPTRRVQPAGGTAAGVPADQAGLDAELDTDKLPKDRGAIGSTQTEALKSIYERTLNLDRASAEDLLDQKRVTVGSKKLKDRFRID